jgi:hypothetical protein
VDTNGARPQDVEPIGGSKIVGALCQRMSKSQLTLVEAAVKTSRRRQDAIATRNIADTEIKA